jgi:polar amino acid transport system substrate-binding protein
MLIVSNMAAAQETILGDTRLLNDISTLIPKEYLKAFKELQSGAVDDIFYKMMQLGRGIQKDDRVAIYGRWQETGKESITNGLRVALFEAESSEAKLGSLLLVFSQLSAALEAGYSDRILLLGKYQGTIGGLPLITLEYVLYAKEVLAIAAQKSQSITPATLQLIATSVQKELSSLNKITVATDATFPPMEMVSENKEIVGFDIDLMNAAAKAGGFTLEFKNTAWDGIFAGLDGGKYDAVMSAVTITDERKKVMAFSIPYINAGQVLTVRADLNGVATLADLKGKKVGAQIGTTGAFEIEKAKEGNDIQEKIYDQIGNAFDELANGFIDGVVVDFPTAASYVLQNDKYKGELKIVGERFTEEYYGVVVKKGNKRVLDLINAGLKKVFDAGDNKAIEYKWLK